MKDMSKGGKMEVFTLICIRIFGVMFIVDATLSIWVLNAFRAYGFLDSILVLKTFAASLLSIGLAYICFHFSVPFARFVRRRYEIKNEKAQPN
jgi:hypothetical protein